MSQCSFISHNKCPLGYRMLIVREAVHVWGQAGYGKSLSSAQFCYKPKTALKKSYVLKEGQKLNRFTMHLVLEPPQPQQ